MAENLISTTPKISMNALAWQGIAVYTCYPQIYNSLERKFGKEVALLFAKPVENKASGEIDWYTPVNGKVRKLADLPEDEKTPLYAQLSRAAEEISKYADEELIRSGKPERVTRGEILKLALRFPDDQALLVVGEQPVITCWGFGPGTPGVEGKYLSRLGQAIPVKAAPAPAIAGIPESAEEPEKQEPEKKVIPAAVIAQPRNRGWLWWLFPLLCLMLLLFLLFTSFGNSPAISRITLFNWKDFPFEKKDLTADLSQLVQELNAIETKVYEHVALCKPQAPAIPAKPNAESEALVIPENSDNMDFLEGEWLCRTGLYNAANNEPVQFSFTFNKNGSGSGTVHEKDGDMCTGKAKGELINGVLKIQLDEQFCKRSKRSYMPLEIECKNIYGAGGTSCAGINSDGTHWEAQFFRLN